LLSAHLIPEEQWCPFLNQLLLACAAACSLPESRTPRTKQPNSARPLDGDAATRLECLNLFFFFYSVLLFCSGLVPGAGPTSTSSTDIDTTTTTTTTTTTIPPTTTIQPPRRQSRRHPGHHDPAARRTHRAHAARKPAVQHIVQRQRVPALAGLPLEPDPLAGERIGLERKSCECRYALALDDVLDRGLAGGVGSMSSSRRGIMVAGMSAALPSWGLYCRRRRYRRRRRRRRRCGVDVGG
jgi:hypothetical protein